jgi:protein SCO1
MPIPFLFRALVMIAAVLIAGCDMLPGLSSKPSFKSTDVTGLGYAQSFAMTDHMGKPRSLTDYKGKVVVVFFGFTFCPDICPTMLSTMREALEKLGKDADKVQVLFVTVDPERDTQAKLALYVPAFHPSFVGLRGDAEATAKIAKEYKIFYQKEAGKTPDTYTISHSTQSYVYDTQGRVRLLLRHEQPVANTVSDFKMLIAGK